MVKLEEVTKEKEATHVYIHSWSKAEEIVEGISAGNFYKLNTNKQTVIDDDGNENWVWNMVDYTLVKVEDRI